MRNLLIVFIALSVIALTGCASLENKAVGIASAVDAVKIETSGSVVSGTVLPNLTLGGAVSVIATSPAFAEGATVSPVYVKSRRNSFFGDLFGLDNSTEAITYIGTPGETADDTAKRVNALNALSTQSAKQ